jgi:hypothetical protein
MRKGPNRARTGDLHSPDSSGLLVVESAAEAEEAEIAVFAAPGKKENADRTFEETALQRAVQPL